MEKIINQIIDKYIKKRQLIHCNDIFEIKNYNHKLHYLYFNSEWTQKKEEFLQNQGFMEYRDYLFRIPKKLTITKDTYSTKIATEMVIRNNHLNTIPENVTIHFNGYGANVQFGNNITFSGGDIINIFTDSELYIDNHVTFGPNNEIIVRNSSKIKIGQNNLFRKQVRITSFEMSQIRIGSACIFNEYNLIQATYMTEIIIGDNILASRNCSFRSEDGHAIFDIQTGKKLNYVNKTSLILEDHIWCGEGVMFLSPAHIATGTIIGAQSLVKKQFPNNVIIAGTPAKIIKENVAWHANPMIDDINKINETYRQMTKKE